MNRAFSRTLGAVWLCRSVLGWLLALPFVAAVADSGVGGLFDGDRVLFEPGGLFLAELGRVSGPLLNGAAATMWPYVLAAFALRTLPQGALFQQTFAPSSGPRKAFGAASARVVPLVTIAAVELLAKVALVGIVVFVEQAAHAEPARRFGLLPAAALLGAGLFATTALADVRRGLLFVDPELEGAALGPALSHVRTNVLPLLGGYALRVGLGMLAVAVAARLVEWIDVGRPGGWRVLAAFALHQLVLGLVTALDAFWIRRVVSPLQPPASFL
ncbi:MAG TPA: hypothetical protein VFQ35_26010 [Polyangiaceae bacterium]|nr:hypothetical protein [Polyangiaceae bacterium]